MLDSQFHARRRARRDTHHRPPAHPTPGSPSGSPSASPSDAPPPPPIPADLQQTLDGYARAAEQDPGAMRREMGRGMAKLNVMQMKILAQLHQLLGNFLSQPGLDFQGIENVLPIMDRVHMESKLVKGFAQVVFETSKPQTNDPPPKDRMQTLPDLEPGECERWGMASVREAAEQIMREGEAMSNSNSPVAPVESPATLPIAGTSEDSRV